MIVVISSSNNLQEIQRFDGKVNLSNIESLFQEYTQLAYNDEDGSVVAAIDVKGNLMTAGEFLTEDPFENQYGYQQYAFKKTGEIVAAISSDGKLLVSEEILKD